MRIGRAKPIVIRTFDVVVTARSFYYGTRIAVPTLTPMPAGLGEVSRVQTCCAPGPTYILKVGPLVIDSVPVQSAATV